VGWLETGRRYSNFNSIYIGLEITDKRVVLDVHDRNSTVPEYRVFEILDSAEPRLPSLYENFCVSLSLGEDTWKFQITKMGVFNLQAEGPYTTYTVASLLSSLSDPKLLYPTALILREGTVGTIDGVSLTFE